MNATPEPVLITANDESDWLYYVPGHDPDELWAVDDPGSLLWENVWMRPIRASQVEAFTGWPLEEGVETVKRDPTTGQFAPVWWWVECSMTETGALPFMGVRYLPDGAA